MIEVKYIPYFLTFISTMIIFFYQLYKEVRIDKNSVLEKKLQKVYAPLYNALLLNKGGKIKDNKEIMETLSEYSYLLSERIVDILERIFELEKESHIEVSNELKGREYDYLKTKLFKLIRNEYKGFKSANDRETSKRLRMEQMSFFSRIFNAVLIVSRNIMLVFLGVYFLLWLYNRYFSTVGDIKSIVITIIGYIVVASFLITLLVYPSRILLILQGKLDIRRERNGKLFHSYDEVDESGIYKCRWCGDKKEVLATQNYGRCTQCTTKQKFVGLFTKWFQWEKG